MDTAVGFSAVCFGCCFREEFRGGGVVFPRIDQQVI